MATPTQFAKLRGADPQSSRVQDAVDQVLRPIAQAVAQTPLMGVAPVWIPHALSSAVSNWGVGFETNGYYKDPFMRVWSKGILICPTGLGAGATILTFPLGYRTKAIQRFPVEGAVATFQAVSLAPTGVLTVEVAVAVNGSLDIGFSFLAEA